MAELIGSHRAVMIRAQIARVGVQIRAPQRQRHDVINDGCRPRQPASQAQLAQPVAPPQPRLALALTGSPAQPLHAPVTQASRPA